MPNPAAWRFSCGRPERRNALRHLAARDTVRPGSMRLQVQARRLEEYADMIDHLDHLVLTTAHEAECIRFYTQALGMRCLLYTSPSPRD